MCFQSAIKNSLDILRLFTFSSAPILISISIERDRPQTGPHNYAKLQQWQIVVVQQNPNLIYQRIWVNKVLKSTHRFVFVNMQGKWPIMGILIWARIAQPHLKQPRAFLMKLLVILCDRRWFGWASEGLLAKQHWVTLSISKPTSAAVIWVRGSLMSRTLSKYGILIPLCSMWLMWIFLC